MDTYVLGDVHGNYKALQQVFELSSFNLDEDRLIVLGDVVDGWSESKECVEFLLQFKNRISILGNHDYWFMEWILAKYSVPPQYIWTKQGGEATLRSYGVIPQLYGAGLPKTDFIPESHIEYFKNCKLYHRELINGQDTVFVHGGIAPGCSVEEILNIDPYELLWDRSMWHTAYSSPTSDNVTQHDRVFIGHTSTQAYGEDSPMRRCEIYNLDTGAGWHGRLSLMRIDTYEYWQSEPTSLLYPGQLGRNG